MTLKYINQIRNLDYLSGISIRFYACFLLQDLFVVLKSVQILYTKYDDNAGAKRGLYELYVCR